MHEKITHQARLLIYSSIILGVTQGFMWVDYPVYLAELGYNAIMIGTLVSVPMFIASFLMIPMGAASDKFGRKRFIIFARAFGALSYLLYMAFTSLAPLFMAGIAQGIAWASAGSSFNALFAEKAEEGDMNYSFTVSFFASTVAGAVGMLLGGLPVYLQGLGLTLVQSYRVIYAMALVGSFASIYPILLVEERYTPRQARIAFFPRRSRGVVVRLSVLGAIGLGAGVLIRIMPYWLYLKYGVNVNLLGPAYAASSILTALASLATPKMARALGEVRTIVFTEAPSIALIVLIPFMPTYWLAVSLYIARSVLMNMAQPIQNSLIMSLVAEEERALSSSLVQFFDSLPRSFGPTISGYFIYLGYLNMPFYFTAILYSISVSAFYALFGRRRALKAKLQP